MFNYITPHIVQSALWSAVCIVAVYLVRGLWRYLKHVKSVLLVLDRHAEMIIKILRLGQICQQPTVEDVKARYEAGKLYQVMDLMFDDCVRLGIPYRTVSRVLNEHCKLPNVVFKPYSNGVGIVLPIGETRFEYSPS